jgi:hypothetical protein
VKRKGGLFNITLKIRALKIFVFLLALFLVASVVHAQRLPTVSGDSNNWGTILNTYLLAEHNLNGSHRNVTVLGDFIVRNGSNNITFLINSSTGNVGIGTLNPTLALVIIGSVNISDSLNVTNTVQATSFVGDGSLLTGIATSTSVWNSSGTNIFLNDSTAKLGIGTPTPSQLLEVAGNVSFLGNLSIEGGIKPLYSINYSLGSFDFDSVLDVNLTGIAASDKFGTSVSFAGDVNGDGYDDVIVGARLNDGSGSNSGATYIFFGNSTLDNVFDVNLTGFAGSDNFGVSVSSAGDINGDGYDDVIVGAGLNDDLVGSAGAAYIFFGNSTMDTVLDVNLTVDGLNGQLGNSVSVAGDVNGDGYDDIIVGAPKLEVIGTSAGAAYIFFGGANMDNALDLNLSGNAAKDNFGSSVSSAGDVNGDGYDDVIVGSEGSDLDGSTYGAAYIYFGGSSMDNILDVNLTGHVANDNFGFSVSSAGDINGDGYDDVIVGANTRSDTGSSAGAAYIFFGGRNMDGVLDVNMTGFTASDNFGTSVSSAGDINGDGYDDVIVGAKSNDDGGSNAGAAYIFFGGRNMDGVLDVNMTGFTASDQFGFSVSYAGDINGDGYDDVIVGADSNDDGGSNAGAAYIFKGDGKRFESVFAQNINLNRGLQMGTLTMDKNRLIKEGSFGIFTANWRLTKQGLLAVQEAVVSEGNMTIGRNNSQTNMTMYSSDGNAWRCGPDDSGGFSCS